MAKVCIFKETKRCQPWFSRANAKRQDRPLFSYGVSAQTFGELEYNLTATPNYDLTFLPAITSNLHTRAEHNEDENQIKSQMPAADGHYREGTKEQNHIRAMTSRMEAFRL